MKVSDSDCVNTEALATRKQSRGITTLEVRNALSRKLHKCMFRYSAPSPKVISHSNTSVAWQNYSSAMRCVSVLSVVARCK